jgi:integrase/recombinase XerD
MQGIPTVVVYVRHAADCAHKDQGEYFNGCDCRKQVRWWKNGKLFRHSAKTRSWAAAEKLRSKIEASFSGDPTVQTGFTSEANVKTIQQAIELFIADKRAQGLNAGVIKKYARELARLQMFFAQQSKFHVREITFDDLIKFRAAWEAAYPSSMTRQKVQERLRSFLRYCYESGALAKVPRLSPIKVDEPPTLPLTEKEYANLLSHCTAFNPDKAKKVHALVQLMRHSGLAIRDAVTLERAEIVWDAKKKAHRIVTSRQKTGVHVSILLAPDVSKELLEVLNGNERYVFWNRGAFGGNASTKRGTNGQETTVVGMYQTALRDLFKAAGVYLEDQHMVSHRLRDTFAVGMLEKGVPMEEVSRMLGNSLRVCEKHYAKWAQSRQDRLDSLVTATWSK